MTETARAKRLARRDQERGHSQTIDTLRAGARARAEVQAVQDWQAGQVRERSPEEREEFWARRKAGNQARLVQSDSDLVARARAAAAAGTKSAGVSPEIAAARAAAAAKQATEARAQAAAAVAAVGAWLGAQHPTPKVRQAAQREQADPVRVEAAAVLCAPYSLRTIALALVGAEFRPAEQSLSYVAWWREATGPATRFACLVAMCGQAAARAAAGKFGKVSSTSVDEAAAAGRRACVRFFRRRVHGKWTLVLPSLDWLTLAGVPCGPTAGALSAADYAAWWQVASAVRGVRRAAVSAGVASLLGDLVSGSGARLRHSA